jgi:transcriptional regulator of NAD metabolism
LQASKNNYSELQQLNGDFMNQMKLLKESNEEKDELNTQLMHQLIMKEELISSQVEEICQKDLQIKQMKEVRSIMDVLTSKNLSMNSTGMDSMKIGSLEGRQLLNTLKSLESGEIITGESMFIVHNVYRRKSPSTCRNYQNVVEQLETAI